jgi:DNA modification methylase
MNNPYFKSQTTAVYQGDFREYLKAPTKKMVAITDPPYNIGFSGYDVHNDNMPDDDYIEMLCELQKFRRVVIIQYPVETMRWVVPALGVPDAVASWNYNANIPNRFRLVNFYGCKPDYSRIKVPYKNLNDSRIRELIKNGSAGTNLYEWWDDIQLVKNVSDEKGHHPCPIPEKLAKRIITLVCNPGDVVVDPFAGSLTVLKSARDLGFKSIGCEKSESYIQEGLARLQSTPLLPSNTACSGQGDSLCQNELFPPET